MDERKSIEKRGERERALKNEEVGKGAPEHKRIGMGSRLRSSQPIIVVLGGVGKLDVTAVVLPQIAVQVRHALHPLCSWPEICEILQSTPYRSRNTMSLP